MATTDRTRNSARRSRPTRRSTSSTRGRCRTRSTRSPVAGGEGRYFWDYDGKRYLDFASQLVNVSTRPPASEARRGDQGAGRQSSARSARRWRTSRAPSSRGCSPRSRRATSADVVLHERRRRGERERDQARALVHRPPQDHRPLPLLPRRHRRRDHADRRPAPLARRARHPRRRAHVRPVHVPLPRRPPRPVPGLLGRRRTSRRSSSTRAPHTVAAVILETVTGTNGIIVPPDGYLQSIREVCDRHGILLICRRGHGRLRPHRHVVRLSTTGTSSPTSSRWPRASTPATCRSAR